MKLCWVIEDDVAARSHFYGPPEFATQALRSLQRYVGNKVRPTLCAITHPSAI